MTRSIDKTGFAFHPFFIGLVITLVGCFMMPLVWSLVQEILIFVDGRWEILIAGVAAIGLSIFLAIKSGVFKKRYRQKVARVAALIDGEADGDLNIDNGYSFKESNKSGTTLLFGLDSDRYLTQFSQFSFASNPERQVKVEISKIFAQLDRVRKYRRKISSGTLLNKTEFILRPNDVLIRRMDNLEEQLINHIARHRDEAAIDEALSKATETVDRIIHNLDKIQK